MPNDVIQYTSRSYDSILNDINSDSELADKPNWFKRLIAGVGDVCSMWNNAVANNLFLKTAYTRRNVQLLLELIDYELTEQATANGSLIYYIKGSAVFPFSLSIADQVALTTGSLTTSAKRFEGRSVVNVTAVNEVFTASDVTDLLTVARVYTTGEKVRVTTSGTLPAPLAINTDYYVIYVGTTTIKLATSLANAYAGTNIDITTTGAGIQTIHLYSKQITCYQQETKDTYSAGESDGTSEFQEFDLADINILSDTISVTINSLAWTRVDTLVDSVSTDRHFRLLYNTDNSARLQFGDGTYGLIPPIFDINVNYAVGGGTDSNVSVTNAISVYGGADSNIEGVSNPTSITGGANPESIESAKILGPLLLKARERFITEDDGKALSENTAGIVQAKVIGNYYGVLSAKIITIANGGGNPSASAKTALQTYLIARTVLETIDVRVEDTTITSQNITSSAKLLNGYVWAGGVQPYFELAWQLFLSETGQEIYESYRDDGIADAIILINTIFSASFDNTDTDTTTQISALLEALENYYRVIGEDLQESDAFAYIQNNVNGVDYMTITASPFPISMTDDEITTDGVLTLAEIP